MPQKLATLSPLSMPGSMSSDFKKKNVLNVSLGNIAYDTSFAKSNGLGFRVKGFRVWG